MATTVCHQPSMLRALLCHGGIWPCTALLMAAHANEVCFCGCQEELQAFQYLSVPLFVLAAAV